MALGRVVVAALSLGILVLASSAFGQAAVDQYVPAPAPEGVTSNPAGPGPGPDSGGAGVGSSNLAPPGSQGGPAGSGEDDAAADKRAGAERATPTADRGGGTSGGADLPGGFPLTPFVLIVAGFVAAAIAAKLLWSRFGRKEETA
jgi:hypothetical protein